MEIKNPQYFGQLLHKKGFERWFLYMFKAIEGRKFIKEGLHPKLFQTYQDVYDLKEKRLNINVCPRSAKTTLAKYFIAYTLADNSKSNFIYTSYSQALLNDISRDLTNILTNPIYLAMYDNGAKEESQEFNAIDEFWQSYIIEETGKATFSSRKITTADGGVVLFSSVGSQITGFGAGVRGGKQFAGCLIIDDSNKPSDIYSQVRRNKVKLYFEETLLSRLNDSEVAIVNIQQRLHLEDLTGFLLEKYKFNLLKLPLVIDGICQLPSQYTPERLEELQKNEFMFLSQYQQTPIISGGAIFKRDCFIFSNELPQKFGYTFITADLAYKDKQHNDFTCFSYWGVLDKKLYLIDSRRKKINAVEIDGWIRPWIMPKLVFGFRYIWIEDKAHGTYLLQQYRKDGLPVPSEQMIKQTLPRDGDKVMRANNIIPCLNMTSPNVIFNNQIEGFNDLVEELLSFNNSTNDDFVDTFIDACKIGLFEKKEMIAF
jgi:predicted phage terminase large subunit-like protein